MFEWGFFSQFDNVMKESVGCVFFLHCASVAIVFRFCQSRHLFMSIFKYLFVKVKI